MSNAPWNLVLGTHNRKKRSELETLLGGLPVRIQTLEDFQEALTVEESGATFGENARLKATIQARHLDAWVLGEDSGLSVEALDGQPGVWSSRFAGLEASDEDNNRKLESLMRSVPDGQRGAWYTCHVILSDPQGVPRIDVQATCRGRITRAPRGTAGFGYDPWFEIPEYHQTFAELVGTVKSVLSHRARAMRQFLVQFQGLVANGPPAGSAPVLPRAIRSSC